MMHRRYGTANVTKESMKKVEEKRSESMKEKTLAREMGSLQTMTAYFERKEKEAEALKKKLWAEEKKRLAKSYKPHDTTSYVPSERVPGGR